MAKEKPAWWIKKFRIKQWSGHYSVFLTGTNADRCFQERLGCSVSREKNWGLVVKEGTGVSYKSFKLLAIKFALRTFSKL